MRGRRATLEQSVQRVQPALRAKMDMMERLELRVRKARRVTSDLRARMAKKDQLGMSARSVPQGLPVPQEKTGMKVHRARLA